MTVNHDAVAAFPIVGNVNKTLARNVLVARMPYVLADTEDSRNLIATDPATGAVIVDMTLLGRVFHYDPTDTTTAHDGTSCLVSADGLRYKLALGTDVFAYAVLDNTIATPPVSPALGDAYLVAASATGAWAGKSNFIAVKTNRGWEFVNFSIGRFIYVESIDTYYHKNAGGAWVTGLGTQTLSANSVPLSAAINFGRRLIVENQTTTAPPGSPTVGTAYIVGPSATGGWAGLDGKLAICEVAGSFVIYTPTNGFVAFDKAQGLEFLFNGTTWVPTTGTLKRVNTSPYNVTAADNNTIISLYGGAFGVVLFPTGSSLPKDFRCTIFNEETTPVGKGIGGVTNLGSFTLYPTQSYDIRNVNNNIVSIGGLKPYKVSSVHIFGHLANGSDDPLVADGLADSARAWKTQARVKAVLYGDFIHNGSQPVCALTGNYTEAVTFAGQPPGCGVFFWNGSAPGSYIVNQVGGVCWIIGDGCVMECSNTTWEGNGNNAVAIELHQTAVLDINSGCSYGNFGVVGSSHIGTDGAGWTLNLNASYTINNGGNARVHWAANGSGILNVAGGITITINGGPASQMAQWVVTSGPILVNMGSLTIVGTPATGCQQWAINPQGWLARGGNTIPGSVAGVPAAGVAPVATTGWVS